MRTFLAYLLLTIASVALGVLVMERGWGLHPQSWWWIIGGGIVGTTVLRSAFDAVQKEEKNKRP